VAVLAFGRFLTHARGVYNRTPTQRKQHCVVYTDIQFEHKNQFLKNTPCPTSRRRRKKKKKEKKKKKRENDQVLCLCSSPC